MMSYFFEKKKAATNMVKPPKTGMPAILGKKHYFIYEGRMYIGMGTKECRNSTYHSVRNNLWHGTDGRVGGD